MKGEAFYFVFFFFFFRKIPECLACCYTFVCFLLHIVFLRIVCFLTREDLERALDKLQGKEVNGRKLKLIDDSERRDSRR